MKIIFLISFSCNVLLANSELRQLSPYLNFDWGQVENGICLPYVPRFVAPIWNGVATGVVIDTDTPTFGKLRLTVDLNPFLPVRERSVFLAAIRAGKICPARVQGGALEVLADEELIRVSRPQGLRTGVPTGQMFFSLFARDVGWMLLKDLLRRGLSWSSLVKLRIRWDYEAIDINSHLRIEFDSGRAREFLRDKIDVDVDFTEEEATNIIRNRLDCNEVRLCGLEINDLAARNFFFKDQQLMQNFISIFFDPIIRESEDDRLASELRFRLRSQGAKRTMHSSMEIPRKVLAVSDLILTCLRSSEGGVIELDLQDRFCAGVFAGRE